MRRQPDLKTNYDMNTDVYFKYSYYMTTTKQNKSYNKEYVLLKCNISYLFCISFNNMEYYCALTYGALRGCNNRR